MTILDIDDIEKVEGWLSKEEGTLLYNLAKACKKGCIVEIGSWKGKSTVYIAKGATQKVYAIDPHKGCDGDEFTSKNTFQEFLTNIKKFNLMDKIIPIVNYSVNASKDFNNNDIGLIFIDGSHKYKDVKEDFEAWFEKIIDGGIIAMHDTIMKHGTRTISNKYIYKSHHFKDIHLVGSITYATKVKNNSYTDRLKNRLLLLKKTIKYHVLKRYRR
ncbi:MAG: class I SAM-dependent methyltransferase [Nanoarchaeota archaeon]